MGLTLRTTHDNLPAGSVVVNRRLTINEMDENFIFLQNLISGLTPITYSDAISLRDNEEIIAGQYYLITDAQPDLYGSDSDFNFGDGTAVLLRGVDSTHFSTGGHGKFYIPNYYNSDIDSGYYVYDSYQSYNLNDYVIYGGRVWKLTNESGNLSADGYLTMGDAWTAQDYTNSNYYTIVWDEIEFDFDNNYINSRYDAINNNFLQNTYNTAYFYCLINTIQGFRWGHRFQDGGVSDCSIINSYFGCLNYTNGRITGITLENHSAIYDVQLYNDSYLDLINLKQLSSINSIYLDNAYMSNIVLTNNSSIYDITMNENSYMSNITLENNSLIYNIDFNDDTSGTTCYIEYISLKNECSIHDITLNGNDSGYCYIRDINLANSSTIYNTTLYLNSYENDVYLSRLDFTNSAEMKNIYLESSDGYSAYFEDITMSNDSYIDSIEAYGSDFSNINISSDSAFAGNYDSVFAYYTSFSYITITNASNFVGDYDGEGDNDGDGSIYFDSSTLKYISLTNNSLFTGPFEMNSDSSIINLSLDYGYFGGMDQDGEYISSIYLESSSINNLLIERYSWISNLDMHYTNMYNTKISNYSRISSNDESVLLTGSTLNYITLDNNSYIGYDRVEIESSDWNNITIKNNSKIGGYIYYYDSTLNTITLNNNSKFWGDSDSIDVRGSHISYINMDNNSEITGYLEIWNNSYVENITLDSSYLGGYNYGFYINNSNFNFINLTNNSYITAENDEITINDNSYFEYVTLGNNSYINGYLEVGEGSIFRNINLTNDSYIEEVDIWDNSEIIDIDIKNNSHLSNIWPSNYSSMRYITITDYSRFTGDIYLYNSGTKVYYINIKNYSYIDAYFYIQSASEIKYIDLDNHSHITGDLYMYSSSKIKRVQMANYSKISGNNHMDLGSEIQYMSMLNVSDNSGTSCYGPGFTNFYLYDNCYIHGLDIKYSSIGGLGMYNSSKIQGVSVENSYWYNTYLHEGAIYNSKFINSYLDGNGDSFNIVNNSYIENVVIDTVDFPSWNRRFGISLDTDCWIKNLTLRNICYLDRVSMRENNTSNLDGMFNSMTLYNGSYIDNMIIENSSEEVDSDFDKYVEYISIQNGANIVNFRSNFSQITGLDLDGDNYVYNVELDNSIVESVTLRNYAYIYGLEAKNSYVVDIIVDDVVPSINASYMEGVKVYNGLLAGIILNNDSYLQSINIDDSQFSSINLGTYSYFTNVDLKNSSSIGNINFGNNSYLSGLNLENDSRLNNLTFNNYSYINYSELKNNSIFESLTLNDSGLIRSQLRSSRLNSFNISDSYMSNFDMNGSEITNINPTGNFYSSNFRMSNSYLNFNAETTPYTTTSMDASLNTIKYQFEYNFNSQGPGTVNITKLFVPGSGWYIEKVIIDADALSSTGTTNISLGLDSAGPECVLNDVDITTLSNKVSVYDISNNSMAYPGIKTSSNDTIKLVLAGDSMSSGSQIIRFEITLKKTNFSTDWWD